MKAYAFAACFALIISGSTASALAQSDRFGAPVKADDATKDLLSISTSRPPKEIAAGAEVVLVSGYEAKEQARSGARIRVLVNRPGKKVLLVLTSYERIAWLVEATPTTTIQAILVGNMNNESSVTTKIKTGAYYVTMNYVDKVGSREFGSVVTKLNELFGIKKVDVVRASYGLPPVVTIADLDPPSPVLTLAGPGVEKPTANFEFKLFKEQYLPVRWTLTGPVDRPPGGYLSNSGFSVAPDGTRVYALTSDRLVIGERSTGQESSVPLPPNFPRFSWATDVAYDSRRDIVSVISLGGEGFLYRFDAKARKWIDFRSANNIDIFSLTYDAKADRYIAWTSDNSLLFISGDGDSGEAHPVRDKLPGFERLYRGGQGKQPKLWLASNGRSIALINFAGTAVKNIWEYDPQTRTGRLTYMSKAEP